MRLKQTRIIVAAPDNALCTLYTILLRTYQCLYLPRYVPYPLIIGAFSARTAVSHADAADSMGLVGYCSFWARAGSSISRASVATNFLQFGWVI